MRWIMAAVALAVMLAACGTAGSQPSPTTTTSAPRTLKYSDPRYHFSFQYPPTWSIARGRGRTQLVQGVQSYVVDINLPDNSAHAQIVIDRNVVPIPQFAEGAVAPAPGGNPDVTLHYHHVTVSGWPSMGIERYNKTNPDEFDTITNTHSLSYQIRILAGQPPFTQAQVQGYRLILRTLHIP